MDIMSLISALGWFNYIDTHSRQPNNKARFISPSTTKTNSCLHFYYHMYGPNVGKLQVLIGLFYLYISCAQHTFHCFIHYINIPCFLHDNLRILIGSEECNLLYFVPEPTGARVLISPSYLHPGPV